MAAKKPTAAEAKLIKAAEDAWVKMQQAIVRFGRRSGAEREPINVARAHYERAIAERAGSVTQPPESERALYIQQGRDEVRHDIAARLAGVVATVIEGVAKEAEWGEDVVATMAPALPGLANRVLAGMGYEVKPKDLEVVEEQESGDE